MLKVTYNERQAKDLEEARKATWRRVLRAAAYLHSELLSVLNKPNSGQRVKGRGGKRHTIYPNPSKPGEPPRKRTGWLQRNVVYEANEGAGTVKVGITAGARYGAFLELGTARMRPRPWLAVTLERLLPELKAIIGGRT